MAAGDLVRVIRKHALEHYEEAFGWSEVVECYSDKEILEVIGDATTEAEALKRMGEVVRVRTERYELAVGQAVGQW